MKHTTEQLKKIKTIKDINKNKILLLRMDYSSGNVALYFVRKQNSIVNIYYIEKDGMHKGTIGSIFDIDRLRELKEVKQ